MRDWLTALREEANESVILYRDWSPLSEFVRERTLGSDVGLVWDRDAEVFFLNSDQKNHLKR